MNVFFNDTIANIIQFISFPLEVLGLTMVWIEYRYPLKAIKFEQFLKFESHQASDWIKIDTRLNLFALIVRGPHIFLVISIGLWWAYFNHTVTSSETTQPIWLLVICILTSIGTLFVLMNYALVPIRKIKQGRRLTYIGILLALLGTTGELYQIIHLIVH